MMSDGVDRPICGQCGERPCERGFNALKSGIRKLYHRKLCTWCREAASGRRRGVYRAHKKVKCEECGFEPIHKCQLDVDHIDGNHNNNNIGNLKTLCANCHRLKTQINKDWEK